MGLHLKVGHRLHVRSPGHGWCPEYVDCPRQVGFLLYVGGPVYGWCPEYVDCPHQVGRPV